MGLVYAEIEIVSSDDIALAYKSIIREEDIKSITVTALVDSGAYMMSINETIRNQLQLRTISTQLAELANGDIVELDVVGPVDIRFKNRSTSCRAIVLPGDSEVLLGSIPMEDMDVLIDPLKQELIVNPAHPFMAQKPIKFVA